MTPDQIRVYAPVTLLLPLGMVIGQEVLLENIKRSVSKKQYFYCHIQETSHVTILTSCKDERKSLSVISTTTLNPAANPNNLYSINDNDDQMLATQRYLRLAPLSNIHLPVSH